MSGHQSASQYPLVKLKHLATSIAGGTPDSNRDEFWNGGSIPWVSISDMSRRQVVKETAKRITDSARQTAQLKTGPPGTVLLAMYASVGEVARLDMEAAWNQALIGLIPKPGRANAKFLQYCLHAVRPWLPALYRSNTQNNINAEQVSNLRVPSPPLNMQGSIADYLDHETAEIDAFIADFERLRELVAERAAANLQTVVWPQNTPEVAMRRIIRSVDQGHSPEADSSPAGPGGVGLLKAGCTNFGVFNPCANKSLDDVESLDRFRFVEPGDLLVTRASGSLNHVGSAAVVPHLDRQLAMSDKLYRISTTADYVDGYLALVMMTERFKTSLTPVISGAHGLARNVSLTALKSIRVPYLSRPQQENIMDAILNTQSQDREGDQLISQAIDLARERRAALISAAVTGQIDVTKRHKPVAEVLEDEVRERV